jgi:hypothetical protein
VLAVIASGHDLVDVERQQIEVELLAPRGASISDRGMSSASCAKILRTY